MEKVTVRFKQDVGGVNKGETRKLDPLHANSLIKDGKAELYGQQPAKATGKKSADPAINELKAEHEEAIAKLNEDHEAAITKLNEDHAAEIEELNTLHTDEVKQFTDQIGILNEALEAKESEGETAKELVGDGPKGDEGEGAGSPAKEDKEGQGRKTKEDKESKDTK